MRLGNAFGKKRRKLDGKVDLVWDANMIQKHEQYNPEHKNKGLWMGITILEFCQLIVERKKISGINGGMRGRLRGVGFGRDRK